MSQSVTITTSDLQTSATITRALITQAVAQARRNEEQAATVLMEAITELESMVAELEAS